MDALQDGQKMFFACFVGNFSRSERFKILEMLRLPEKVSLKSLQNDRLTNRRFSKLVFGPVSWHRRRDASNSNF